MTRQQRKPTCFVISQIGDEGSKERNLADQVYKHIIRPVAEEFGYNVIRADEDPRAGDITSQIVEHLINDAMVIADLTDHNANVFYELATRHATGKPVVQLIQKGQRIPFDVSGSRTIKYDLDLDGADEAKNQLGRHISSFAEFPDRVDNPIVAAVRGHYQMSGNPIEAGLLTSRDSVYDGGISLLLRQHWKKVRLFAPVGLWLPVVKKRKWLETLAQQARNGGVDSVWAVFGLPPTSKRGKHLSTKEIQKHLKNARQALTPLSGVGNVVVHYYPPTQLSVGNGVIIFEDDNGHGHLAVAMATRYDEDVINRGFVLDSDGVISYAKDWFDDIVFRRATNRYILQDGEPCLLDRWQSIIRNAYPVSSVKSRPTSKTHN